MKGYGHFNTKYDVDLKVERTDHLIAPESDLNTTTVTVWKTVWFF